MSSRFAPGGRNIVRVAWAAGARHPETPRWLLREAALVFIDGASGELLRLQPDEAIRSRTPLADELGFVTPDPDGRLLFGTGTTVGRVGDDAPFAVVPGEVARLRLNDAGFDADGGLWTGTMDRRGEAPLGAIWRIDAAGRVEAVVDGFTIPNGFALDRSGATLYVADSPRRTVHAFELAAGGRLRARRVFAADETLCDGFPDGMCVDAEDHLWIAFYEGGCLGRFRPDGTLERRVRIPAARVTACAFGGPGLATLYVTAGDGLYAFEPGVPGHPPADGAPGSRRAGSS